MKHYIVLCDYCIDGESGVEVIAVSHSKSKAVALYKEQLQTERKNAESNGYDCVDEDADRFDAYVEGDHCMNHITLYIDESDSEDEDELCFESYIAMFDTEIAKEYQRKEMKKDEIPK